MGVHVYKNGDWQDTALPSLVSWPLCQLVCAMCSSSPTSRWDGFHTEYCHIHFLLGPLLGALQTLTTMVGLPGLCSQPATLLLSPLSLTITQGLLSRKDSSTGHGAPAHLQNSGSLTPSLLTQLFREKEGRGRYARGEIFPQNTRHSEVPV